MSKINKKDAKKNHTIEDDFYFVGCILFVVIVAVCLAVVLMFFKWPELKRQIRLPPCLFHLLTGYYCPGCGGTRAVAALLHGHILQSLYYHPVVVYGAAVYICFMATQTVERFSHHRILVGIQYRNGYVWMAGAIILVNFILKNTLYFFYGFSL